MSSRGQGQSSKPYVYVRIQDRDIPVEATRNGSRENSLHIKKTTNIYLYIYISLTYLKQEN